MKELAIFCKDDAYSRKLAEYLSEKIEYEFLVKLYFSKEELLQTSAKKKIDTLIIEESIYESIGGELKNEKIKIICLTEDINTKKEDCITIYRYQSASAIVPQVVTFNKDICFSQKDIGATRIISVYSPIGGIGTTSFSLGLSRERGKKGKVLYISLEVFSAVSEALFLDEKISISEAIYSYITEGEANFDKNKYIQKVDGFDILAPARSYIEVKTIEIESWRAFILYIKNRNEYEEIVLELSNCVDSFMELFKISDLSIVLKGNGFISEKKVEIFQWELMKELTKKVHDEKIKYIDVPLFEKKIENYDDIEVTEMGRLVKKIASEL